MKINGEMELISFKPVEGVENSDFFSELIVLNQFFKKQEGYRKMNILQDDEGHFTLILRWDSKEAEKNATIKMMKSEKTKSFLSMVNPSSVVKKVLPCYEEELV